MLHVATKSLGCLSIIFIYSLTLRGTHFKGYLFIYTIIKPIDSKYDTFLILHFNMTIDCYYIEKPRHYMILIKISGILIPEMLSNIVFLNYLSCLDNLSLFIHI